MLPALLRFPNFTAQTESEVTKINLDSTGKRATGVTYVDTSGEEWEQPANIVLVCAFALFNVRLMLLSGIGKPYDPQSGQGVVGRNYAYQTMSSVNLILKDKILNTFMATGANGMMIDDYNGDNFDHGALGFVGGGYMGMGQTNARPIATMPVPQGTPKWGAQWKKAAAETYLHAMSLSVHGSSYSYRDCWLDLDPTYKDRLGRPLMRMTFDFHDNELKMSANLTQRLAEIARALDPTEINSRSAQGALYGDGLPDDAQHRRHRHGRRPRDQRGQSLLPELGRAQRLRSGRGVGVSAEPRLQSDRHGRRSRILDRRRDRRSLPEKSRSAGVRRDLMRSSPVAAVLIVALTGAASAQDEQSFDRIERGRYLAVLADCAACHTAPGGQPFAGGLALQTPFGKLVAPNITPDRETGIGDWTDDEFVAAMHDGRGRGGTRLYPAMPYPAYTKMTRDDVLAIRSYLATVDPVSNAVVVNQLPFPLNIRFAMVFWNWLNFTPGRYQPDPQKPAAWNRGAYIVEGAGHCGTCHTPKTLSAATRPARRSRAQHCRAGSRPTSRPTRTRASAAGRRTTSRNISRPARTPGRWRPGRWPKPFPIPRRS